MIGTKTDLTNDEELKKQILETPGEKVVEEGDVWLFYYSIRLRESVKN